MPQDVRPFDREPGAPLGWLDGLGVAVWLVGFTFEAGSDIQLARFLASYLPGEAVASTEAGAIAYFGDGRLVDLVGLGHIGIARHRRAGTMTPAAVEAILEQEAADTVVVYAHYFSFVVDWPAPESWTHVGTWVEPEGRESASLLFFARSASGAQRLRTALTAARDQVAPMTLVLVDRASLSLADVVPLGGVVVVEPDRVAFYSNGVAQLTVPDDGSLILTASGSLVDGVGPVVSVARNGTSDIDERQLSETRTEVRLDGLRAGDVVTIRFTNDATGGGGSDRNLYLWSARLIP